MPAGFRVMEQHLRSDEAAREPFCSHDTCRVGKQFHYQQREDLIMSGKGEEIKGRIKEAAGALTNDDKLRADGQADQVVGKAKQVATKVIDKAQQVADAAAEKARQAAK
jgi:uncharacterized protein YjbJ (UPF0337 family)